jgi:hypothetical protein
MPVEGAAVVVATVAVWAVMKVVNQVVLPTLRTKTKAIKTTVLSEQELALVVWSSWGMKFPCTGVGRARRWRRRKPMRQIRRRRYATLRLFFNVVDFVD